MPEMDLGQIDSIDLSGPAPLSGALGDAAFRLVSYMTWPSDEVARRHYLAMLGASALADLEHREPQNFGLALDNDQWARLRQSMMGSVAEEHFHPHGGFSAIVASQSQADQARQIQKARRDWHTAGTLVYTLRSIARHHPELGRGASVRKVVGLMERFYAAPDTVANRTGILEAWARCKRIGHLCAAWLVFAADAKKRSQVGESLPADYWLVDGLGITLAIARDYQHFLTSYYPHGQRQPLASEDELWLVPRSLTLPPAQAPTAPLPHRALERLRAYQARR
jgi:hypothetical protein